MAPTTGARPTRKKPLEQCLAGTSWRGMYPVIPPPSESPFQPPWRGHRVTAQPSWGAAAEAPRGTQPASLGRKGAPGPGSWGT